MDSSIAILCRGKSLKYVGELPAVEQYIIVNRFGDELSDDTLANVLMNKKINQVLTLVPDEPTLMIQRGYDKIEVERRMYVILQIQSKIKKNFQISS